MNAGRLGRLLRLALLLMLAAFATTAVADDETTPQLLVMLKLPPPHYRSDGAYGAGYGDSAGLTARRRVARALAEENGLRLEDDWPMPMLGVHCFVMTLPARADAERTAQRLSEDKRVAWAQPLHVYKTQEQTQLHGDPLYRVQPAAQAWHLSDLHALATGRGVQVAVVDSGVEERHPDLDGQVAQRENFVARQSYRAEQHGTGVAAVIAARADNGVGIVGVAPQARVQALRACWQLGDESSRCDSLSLAQALQFAIAHEAQVINLSLAGPSDRLLAQLLDLALARGIDVVSAADPSLPSGGFPASHPGVLAVVPQGAQAPPAGMLAAPGTDVPTAATGGRWAMRSGSSFAAAHVSGLLALWHELHPERDMRRVAFVPDAGGAIDACATLRVMNACACACRSARAEPAAAPARP
jgi:hypothetical protein